METILKLTQDNLVCTSIVKSAKHKSASAPCLWTDSLCQQVTIEDNIATTFDLWESIGILLTVIGLLLFFIATVKLNQVTLFATVNIALYIDSHNYRQFQATYLIERLKVEEDQTMYEEDEMTSGDDY